MPKPALVIVGRPNVGKSSLFNRIVGSKAAIVEDVPGVTRDRNYLDAEWEGVRFVAVDTGGFYPEHDDNIFVQIKEQALFAIEEGEVIIHLLDGEDGLNPFDRDLAEVLRESDRKVIWAVNKVDGPTKEGRVYEFYSLGLEDLVPVSATTGYNFEELMDKAAALLPHVEERIEESLPRVAIIGRPNVGKSTMVNSLLGKKRMLVSPVAGTTRDAVDAICSYYRRRYLLIDTAGIQRKQRRGYSLERFAMVRALRSIERADVAVIMIDATEGIVAEDQKIAGLVRSHSKGAVFVFNKWDLVQNHEEAYKKLMRDFRRRIWFFGHAPVLTTSGLDRKRITKLFPLVDGVIAERRKRIPTAELNKFAETISLPPHGGRKVKIYYMTQYGVEPPSFSIFTNNPEGIKSGNVRYMESRLREAYSFAGTPIEIKIRQRK